MVGNKQTAAGVEGGTRCQSKLTGLIIGKLRYRRAVVSRTGVR